MFDGNNEERSKATEQNNKPNNPQSCNPNCCHTLMCLLIIWWVLYLDINKRTTPITTLQHIYLVSLILKQIIQWSKTHNLTTTPQIHNDGAVLPTPSLLKVTGKIPCSQLNYCTRSTIILIIEFFFFQLTIILYKYNPVLNRKRARCTSWISYYLR